MKYNKKRLPPVYHFIKKGVVRCGYEKDCDSKSSRNTCIYPGPCENQKEGGKK